MFALRHPAQSSDRQTPRQARSERHQISQPRIGRAGGRSNRTATETRLPKYLRSLRCRFFARLRAVRAVQKKQKTGAVDCRKMAFAGWLIGSPAQTESTSGGIGQTDQSRAPGPSAARPSEAGCIASAPQFPAESCTCQLVKALALIAAPPVENRTAGSRKEADSCEFSRLGRIPYI